MIDYGRGVFFRAIDREHAPALREWRNHEEIAKWCRQYSLISDMDQEKWLERQNTDPSVQMFLVCIPDVDGEALPVGVTGLTSIDLVNRRAEFSLYVSPGNHRKGYGARALSTLLDYGFRRLGLNVIWGESFAGNPAVKMFTKLGFQYEGHRRDFYFREGRFIDAHLYSIKAAEWIR